MAIWFREYTLEELNQIMTDTLISHVGIEFVEIGEDFLRARMPVDRRTRQPMGILHGGASLVLAETLGSAASNLVLNRDEFYAVGLEINANHVRSVASGHVTGTPALFISAKGPRSGKCRFTMRRGIWSACHA